MSTTTISSKATHSVRFINADGVEEKSFFGSSADAWAFYKACGAEGILAGYPDWIKGV